MYGVFNAICTACDHKWIATQALPPTNWECPKCHLMTGVADPNNRPIVPTEE